MTPERRAERLRHHMYETCEGIAEHAGRIVDLEELALDMRECIEHGPENCQECGLPRCMLDEFGGRMSRLGVEP